MQALGRYAHFVKQQKRTVLNSGAPRSAPKVPTRRSLHGRIDNHYLAGGAQSSRKLHVLHQRNRRESAQALENFAPHKDRLVAKQHTAVSRPTARHPVEKPQPRMPIVEFTIKCAADDMRILHDRINREQMGCRQFGIGVLKNQDVTRGSLRPAVHLFTAIRRV